MRINTLKNSLFAHLTCLQPRTGSMQYFQRHQTLTEQEWDFSKKKKTNIFFMYRLKNEVGCFRENKARGRRPSALLNESTPPSSLTYLKHFPSYYITFDPHPHTHTHTNTHIYPTSRFPFIISSSRSLPTPSICIHNPIILLIGITLLTWSFNHAVVHMTKNNLSSNICFTCQFEVFDYTSNKQNDFRSLRWFGYLRNANYPMISGVSMK